MNLTSVASLWVMFCGYDLVFNSVAEVGKCTELMSRMHQHKLKGQATRGSGHLPDPEKSQESRSRNQTVSSKSSKLLQEPHSAGPGLHPCNLARLPVLVWDSPCPGSFQPLPGLQLRRTSHSQSSTAGAFPQPFPLHCRGYFIICPWIFKVYIELDWMPGQFKEGITSSISS